MKFDVGTPITIPADPVNYPMRLSKSLQGTIFGVSKPTRVSNPAYIFKVHDEENASLWSIDYIDRYAIVSQLSFKEQRAEEDAGYQRDPVLVAWIAKMREEIARIYSGLFVQTDTEALHKKLDEMSERWSK